jgi:hypothetical protein
MKIKGQVTENRVVKKEVMVEVSDDQDEEAIEQAIRKAAYENEADGWATIEVFDVQWEYERINQ